MLCKSGILYRIGKAGIEMQTILEDMRSGILEEGIRLGGDIETRRAGGIPD